MGELRVETAEGERVLEFPMFNAHYKLDPGAGTITAFIAKLDDLSIKVGGYFEDDTRKRLSAWGELTRYDLPVFEGFSTGMQGSDFLKLPGLPKKTWEFWKKHVFAHKKRFGPQYASIPQLDRGLVLYAMEKGVVVEKDLMLATIRPLEDQVIHFMNGTGRYKM